MRLFRQLFFVFGAVGVLCGMSDALHLRCHQDRLAEFHGDPALLPSRWKTLCLSPIARSRSREPIAIPGMGAPKTPSRQMRPPLRAGRSCSAIHCQMCHGPAGEGNGPIAPFLVNFKPANLTLPVVQIKSDGALFLTITNGVTDACRPQRKPDCPRTLGCGQLYPHVESDAE